MVDIPNIMVIIGGQFGSEGKGKLVAHLALKHNYSLAIKCGGPNAGHTIWPTPTRPYVVRQLPSAVVNPQTKLYLCPGAIINPKLLLNEIQQLEELGLDVGNRLCISPFASVIDSNDIEAEVGMNALIGSTESGTGNATAQRVLRIGKIARDIELLKPFISSFTYYKYPSILVEGTQGSGLSLYHSNVYPYCTSRDTSASHFLSEAGLPTRGAKVGMVIRTYPIRVAGNSGPLQNEISWDEIRKRSGYPIEIHELSSITRRVRRVGEFYFPQILDACRINAPDFLAIQGIDYLDYRNFGITKTSGLTAIALEFISRLETLAPVRYIFTGPRQEHIIEYGV